MTRFQAGRALLWIALAAIPAVAAQAQPARLGEPFRIDDPNLSYRTVRRALPTPGGGFAVAWWQLSGGIFVRAFDAEARPLGAAARLDDRTSSEFLGSDLAPAAGGGYLAVWVERATRDGAQAARVFARRLTAALEPDGAAFTITAPAPFAIGVRIAPSPDGFVAVWVRGGPEVDDLVVRRLDPAGAPAGDEIVAVHDTSGLGVLESPSVAVDGVGRALLLWNQYGVREWWALFARGLSPSGELGPVRSVSGARSAYCASPVLVDPAGGFLVAWEDAIVIDYSRTQDLKLQRFTADGAPAGDSRLLQRPDGTGNASDRCPALALAGEHLFLGWTRELASTTGYESMALAALYDITGAPRGGHFRLGSTSSFAQYAATVAAPGEDRLLAVWGDGLADGVDPVDLLGQRFAIPPAAIDPCRFDGSSFLCDTTHGGEGEPLRATFGTAGDVPLLAPVGGQGRDELCVYRAGWFLCDLARDGGAAELTLRFAGRPVDRPFLADLNGDGAVEPCVARRGIFLCDTARNGGAAEVLIRFGHRDAWPLMGDADGDGDDEPCVWRGGRFLCDTAHDGGTAEARARFGLPGHIPLLADADRDGDDDFCVYRGDRFLCDTAHDGGAAEAEILFPASGGVPLLGNVDGI